MNRRREDEEEEKKKKSDIEAEIFLFIQKSTKAAVDAALDELLKGWK